MVHEHGDIIGKLWNHFYRQIRGRAREIILFKTEVFFCLIEL